MNNTQAKHKQQKKENLFRKGLNICECLGVKESDHAILQCIPPPMSVFLETTAFTLRQGSRIVGKCLLAHSNKCEMELGIHWCREFVP